MGGVAEKFVSLVRAIVGLPDEPGKPPIIDRLALYRCTVQSCASDGSKCDVTPEDSRVSGEKNVKIKAGIPGATAVVSDGAIALLGWEGGDPSKPYVVPSWESATVTKLIFAASMLYLSAEGGSNFVALANKVQNYLTSLSSAINGWTPVSNDGGAALKTALSTAGIIGGTWGTDCAATKVKAV